MAIRHIDAHWRDSGRSPNFFGIDARAAFPLVLFLMHIKMWSFIAALAFTLFFGLLSHYGLTTVVFLRLFRTYLSGAIKQARPWWREERMR